MAFLPIPQRELIVASRRKSTYRGRFLAACAAFGLVAWIFLVSNRFTEPHRMGSEMFTALSVLCFGYALLIGTRTTADCISEEKREGTLGLLFLTDLRGYDVVIGKLVATSLNAAYGLLAILPILAMPLLLGGIALSTLCLVALTILNTLFFSLSTGLFASAVSKQERKATALTFFIILFFTALVPALGLLVMLKLGLDPSNELMLPFLLTTPGYGFGLALSSSLASSSMYWVWFWCSLGMVHLLGWLFLLAACRVVRHAWQEHPASRWRVRWQETWSRWSQGRSDSRHTYRTRLLDINPILWLSSRNRLQGAMLWGFLGCLLACYFYGLYKIGKDWYSAPVGIMCAVILNITLKFWLASEACRRFVDDRQENALELLLSTPLTVKEIFHGQTTAMRRLFAGPLVAVVLFEAFLCVAGLQDINNLEERTSFTLAFLASFVTLVADMVAIVWVGMWQGLSAKNARTASGNTLVRILVIPWLLFAILMTLFTIVSRPTGGIEGVIVLWTFISLGCDLFFGFMARQKLHENLRNAALIRPREQSTRSWWPF